MSIKTNNQCRRVIVLDTSAFLAGFDPFSLGEEQITAPLVEDEIKRNAMIKFRFETAVESGKVKVKAPSQEFLNKVKASAEQNWRLIQAFRNGPTAFGFSLRNERIRLYASINHR